MVINRENYQSLAMKKTIFLEKSIRINPYWYQY